MTAATIIQAAGKEIRAAVLPAVAMQIHMMAVTADPHLTDRKEIRGGALPAVMAMAAVAVTIRATITIILITMILTTAVAAHVQWILTSAVKWRAWAAGLRMAVMAIHPGIRDGRVRRVPTRISITAGTVVIQMIIMIVMNMTAEIVVIAIVVIIMTKDMITITRQTNRVAAEVSRQWIPGGSGRLHQWVVARHMPRVTHTSGIRVRPGKWDIVVA